MPLNSAGVTMSVLLSSNGRMSTALQSRSPRDGRNRATGSLRSSLPDLSIYNNPANAPAEFQRGLRTGKQTALRARTYGVWNLNDENFAVDIALDRVPVAQSMSFAFLKGFAAGFRETYRARSGLY